MISKAEMDKMQWALIVDKGNGKKHGLYPIPDKTHWASAVRVILINGPPLWLGKADRRRLYDAVIHKAEDLGIRVAEDTKVKLRKKILTPVKPPKSTFIFR